jgi:GNAT superfamily N-acetyltransferase
VLEAIGSSHILSDFDCGKPPLNNWLQLRALSNHRNGFTSVAVVHEQLKVLGYYGLAPTAVTPTVFPRSVRTGQPPDPIPCILLGRLAVDQSVSRQGLGRTLLRHALRRSLHAAKLIGGRAVLVSAIDEDAVAYWISRGFYASRDNPFTLFMGMKEVELTIEKLRPPQ